MPFIAIILISLLALIMATILVYFSQRADEDSESLASKIDELLPQTQCAQCGFPGCRPYAQAIADGEADINQCPPGGNDTIEQLAQLLDRPVIALNTEFGETKSEAVAFIDEPNCIGCTLCIHACPVDAIVGASKLMHTIIETDCTGCELCLPPCPVDCIQMIPTRRFPA